MSATQASRQFADVLQRVSAGESIIVIRNGQPVARISPPPSPANGAAVIGFLDSWAGDDGASSRDQASWLDALAEPNQRDRQREAWLGVSR